MSELLPCPFCRSTNLRRAEMYYDDDGEHEGIECLDCDANARADRWNQRPVCEWTRAIGQYETACEAAYSCLISQPSNFCPNCGGKVEVV